MTKQSTITRKALDQVILAVLETGAVTATKYLSPRQTIKATRRRFRRGRSRKTEILVTAGGPNYSERKFIKDAIKAGEPFPVKRVILRMEKGAKARG